MMKNAKKFPNSAKKKLSLEGTIIKVLMKNQPMQKSTLKERLKVSTSQLWRTMELLKNEKMVAETPKGFVLSGFTDSEANVSVALKEFKELGYEAVELYDLANRVGEAPSKVQDSAFKLAGNYGLRIESVSRRRQSHIKSFLGPEPSKGEKES